MIFDITKVQKYTDLEEEYLENNMDAIFDFFLKETNNYFTDNTRSFIARVQMDNAYNTITFKSSNVKLITDLHLHQGGYIYINCSYDNNGFYQIKTITEDTITIEDRFELLDEDNDIQLLPVRFPKGLIKLLVDMLEFDSTVEKGITSESYARHSISYRDGYDMGLIKRIATYTKVGW